MPAENANLEGPLTILLVEDNPLDAELFSEFLADAGAPTFRIVHVPRLALAIERIERGGIDIVFLDYMLPDSDGLTALARLRRCAPKVPVILLTGIDDDEVGLKAVAAGAQDYLVKGQIAERTLWRVLRYAIVRKRIEEQLRERQMLDARVQQAQRAESLEILAGGVAHEFNNLLTGILGNVSMAIAELPAESPVLHMLQDIQTAAQRASKVTAQMLTYSGHGRFSKTAVDLSRLVSDLMPLLEPAIRDRGQLSVQSAPRPLTVHGALPELRQVIVSLVTNAAEALRGQEGVIRVVSSAIRLPAPTRIEQGSTQTELPAGHYACVTVSDTGCGISPENLPRIFDPFFTTKFAGRGLGLASVLGIVRGHDGAIKVTSEEDRGTTVEVILPLCDGAAPQADASSPDGAAPQLWQWDGTALVVDDEPLIVSLVRKILTRHGLAVQAVGDWRASLAVVRGQPGRLRLILMDADRLAPSPLAALAALRAEAPSTPVLLWGGQSEEEAARLLDGLEHGAFVHKPFPPSALLAKVHHLLG